MNRLQTGEARGADVAYGFVFSTEFRNMNLCNSCYVDAMYQAFFGRTADEAGKADWMNRLAEGQTRGAVMTALSIRKNFLRYALPMVLRVEAATGATSVFRFSATAPGAVLTMIRLQTS